MFTFFPHEFKFYFKTELLLHFENLEPSLGLSKCSVHK
jgi:hypothetical protein